VSAPIVILRRGDGERLAELETACGQDAAGAETWDAALARPEMFFLGIEDRSGRLAAMVSAAMTPDHADIHDLLVAPSERRRGLARQLVRALARHAGQRGIARLCLEVSENNLPARTLYERTGFRLDGTRRNYYRDGSEALLMSVAVAGLAGLGQ